MKTLPTAVAALALVGILAAPLRADEDCDTVVKALEEALSISSKNFDETMAQLKKTMSQGADDKTKASVKNTFCSVVKALEEALSISSKNFDETMAQLKKTMSQGADDKTKASVKNTFCSVVGEMLGTSRAARAIAGECGATQRPALASLDKSITEIEGAIDNTCK